MDDRVNEEKDLPNTPLTPQEKEDIAEMAARKVLQKAYAEFGRNAFKWALFALGLGCLYVFHLIAKDWHPFK